MVRRVFDTTGYILDPHGACAYLALETRLRPGEQGIFLATAHPAKFTDTIERILGKRPPVPQRLASFLSGKKQTVPMTREFDDFRQYLLAL